MRGDSVGKKLGKAVAAAMTDILSMEKFVITEISEISFPSLEGKEKCIA